MNIKKNKKELDKTITEINDLKKNLLNLRFKKSTGQLEQTSNIKKTKKKIAILKTQLNQKEIRNKNAQ